MAKPKPVAKAKAKPKSKPKPKAKPKPTGFPFLFFGLWADNGNDCDVVVYFTKVVTPAQRLQIARYPISQLQNGSWQWGESASAAHATHTVAVMPAGALSDLSKLDPFFRAIHAELPIREVVVECYYDDDPWSTWSLAQQPKGPTRRPACELVEDLEFDIAQGDAEEADD